MSRFYTKKVSECSRVENQQYFHEICEWERIEYGLGKHRIPKQLEEWAEVMPVGITYVLDSSSKLLVGYIDIWQLKADAYTELSTGMMLEEEIPTSAIDGDFLSGSNLWYVGSIITSPQVRLKSKIASGRIFLEICKSMTLFFQSINKYPITLLGVGSSEVGRHLVTKWGFDKVQMNDARIDTRQRYQLLMTDRESCEVFTK